MWSPTLLLSDSLQFLQSTDFVSCLAITLEFKIYNCGEERIRTFKMATTGILNL